MAALGVVEEMTPDGQQKQHKDSRESLEQRLDLPGKSSLFLRLCLILVVMAAIVLRLIKIVMEGELC